MTPQARLRAARQSLGAPPGVFLRSPMTSAWSQWFRRASAYTTSMILPIQVMNVPTYVHRLRETAQAGMDPAAGYTLGRRNNRRAMTVARTLIAMLETTGTQMGGFPVRPRPMASTSRNTALHAGHRHAAERRPIGAISVPSFGQAHAFCATSVIFTTSGTQLRRRTPFSHRSTERWVKPLFWGRPRRSRLTGRRVRQAARRTRAACRLRGAGPGERTSGT